MEGNYSLAELLGELQSFIDIDSSDIEKAVNSKITCSNNPRFRALLLGWEQGRYDNDLDVLYFNLMALVK
jgi:hypothetical protein